ncbi:hypothetical protein KAR91_64180 [Candidatus Pacearchaeota archaeon]|nr:hypothetical protein [Candidatus Pacearchaeota archaeon]
MADKKLTKIKKRKLKKDGTPYPSSTGKPNPVADQSNWRKKLQQSRLKFDDEQKTVYCEALADHGLKGRAAETAGVCRRLVAQHLENDPDFLDAVNEAVDRYRDKRVEKAMDLAFEGIEVKKYNKDGDLIETRRDHPVRLIELELKRIEPGYREKQTVDMNFTGGVMVAPADMTPEEWIAAEQAKNTKPPITIDEKGEPVEE